MIRSALALAVLPVLYFLAPQSGGPAPLTPVFPPGGPCANSFPHEPVLVYDMSGGSLTGLLHRKLMVYSDGQCTAASLTGMVPTPNCAITMVTAADIRQLQSDLRVAGAWQACDEYSFVFDAPLTTITVLGGTPSAPSRTFSFFWATGIQAATAAVVDQFFATHFPGM